MAWLHQEPVVTALCAGPPLPVSAHQPDAKMTQRRLYNLLRMVGTRALSLDRVRQRNCHRITGHPRRHDRHARRYMDDPANRALFRDGKIHARLLSAWSLRSNRLTASRSLGVIGRQVVLVEIAKSVTRVIDRPLPRVRAGDGEIERRQQMVIGST
jgi:hypothetical protein